MKGLIIQGVTLENGQAQHGAITWRPWRARPAFHGEDLTLHSPCASWKNHSFGSVRVTFKPSLRSCCLSRGTSAPCSAWSVVGGTWTWHFHAIAVNPGIPVPWHVNPGMAGPWHSWECGRRSWEQAQHPTGRVLGVAAL